jgi:hypothetical protein
MCKHVVSMGIEIPLLLTLETAVIKKIEQEGVLLESKPFQVMQDIECYNKNSGMKKQLYDITLAVTMVKEIFGAPEYCNEHFHEIKYIRNDRR